MKRTDIILRKRNFQVYQVVARQGARIFGTVYQEKEGVWRIIYPSGIRVMNKIFKTRSLAVTALTNR